MELTTWMWVLITFLVTMVAGTLFGFYLLQEKLIFSPVRLPLDYEYPFDGAFEERNYRMESGVQLNALLFTTQESKGLVFYVHGNDENLRYWGEYAKHFTKHGYDVFMYDFRGYGKSSGQITSERMIQRDSKQLYTLLQEEYKGKPIILYGYSIGTGIASRLAIKNKPSALILECPFYNFIDIVKYHKAYLPANLITKYYFRTDRYLSQVSSPIYLIHGTEDRKVPYNSAIKLAKEFPQTNMITIEGGTHNDLQQFDLYHQTLEKILA